MAGRTKFNRGKFKELVLYFSRTSLERGDEGFGMVKLNKLLYRADFEAFRLLSRAITWETYEKQEYGPVARDLPIVLDELGADGRLNWQLLPSGPYTRKVPTASDKNEALPDLTLFPAAEKEIIERVLNELAEYGGKGVSEWSHEQSSGWQAAAIGQEIPYGSALVSTEPLSNKQMNRAIKRSRKERWAEIIP